TGIHNTIGEDLVNHCVNDIMVQGADPLFFLDYFATGRLSAKVTAQVIEGISRGCAANGCALIGGETAEMPGLYAEGEYDLAGFIVGAVERRGLITGARIREGDVLLGMPSTGLHTNGYSLARKLLFETAGFGVDSHVPELGSTVGEELLKIHRSYAAGLRALRSNGLLKGAAHITGGGITENTPRMLPGGLAAEIDCSSWRVPAVFELLRGIGSVPLADWRRTFNLGVGMIVAVQAARASKAEALLRAAGQPAWRIGRVVAQSAKAKRVVYV
ncbi:MAG: phosphoribosylformylglycinamidine cyclo-ligase, partial [Acidobacteria bacterium]|nr:phosphoribosylformylglycinamidine cyclo-ligase [Acidobacteriota bacterium]